MKDRIYGIEVTVSGAGGMIGDIMYIIEQSLEEVGFNVVVKDTHQDKPYHPFSPKAIRKSVKVTLIANHLPWPG